MRRLLSAYLLFAAVPTLATAQQQPLQPDPVLAPLPPALPRTHTPQPTTSAITAADLMTRLYIFADDSMKGRRVGREGNVKGTNYLAREVKRLGLKPGGEGGTYFQTLPLVALLPAPGASMSVGGRLLVPGTDFLLVQGQVSGMSIPVIYGGRAGGPWTLTPEQIKGKLVVFSAPSDDTLQKDPDGAFGFATTSHIKSDAVGALYVALDKISAGEKRGIQDPLATFSKDQRASAESPTPLVLLRQAIGDKLFDAPLAQLAVGAIGKNIALTYAFTLQPGPHPARNVIAILPGSDPVLKHQYVAIGAHNDHLGMGFASEGDHDSLRVYTHFASIGGAETQGFFGQGGNATAAQMDSIKATLARMHRTPRRDSIYNGADDDGSGSIGVLEIAEHLAAMRIKPKRSIIFVWHTGEESGLWGSEWFTDHPTIPRDSIVAQLNVDMIGRGDASDIPEGGPNYLEVVGARRRSTELGNLVDTVNKIGHYDFALDYVRGEKYYTRSDHYNYARFGIPIAFFLTGAHPDYHQVTDEPQYIDYKKMARITALINDVAVHIANLNHRLVLDHALDPTQ